MKKSLVIPLVVVLLVVIGGIVWYKSDKKTNENNTNPNTVTAAEWKSYRNDKYGFEIKYPSDWTVTPTEPAASTPPAFDGRAKLTLNFGKTINSTTISPISLQVYEKQTADSLIEYFDYDKTEFSEVTIAGVKGLQISKDGSPDKPFNSFFNSSEYGFEFTNHDESNSQESFELAKKILDSIKFTR